MSFPRPDDESKAFLASLMPEDPRIQIRPMFGNLGAFVNGNMFAGLFGQQVFIRLPDSERSQLMDQEGVVEFSPMPGKPMKEYVTIPDKWRQHPEQAEEWIGRSLEFVGAMPEKVPAKKTNSKTKTKKEK